MGQLLTPFGETKIMIDSRLVPYDAQEAAGLAGTLKEKYVTLALAGVAYGTLLYIDNYGYIRVII